MGGGTTATLTDWPRFTGLSPRGRGNPSRRRFKLGDPGSIPAWAGEPSPIPGETASPRVYPRVGGGTNPMLRPRKSTMGLSPRGRGNQRRRGASQEWLRSIPAWAGEPNSRFAPDRPPRVYPRVGGGTPPPPAAHATGTGLSPRGRGNRRQVLPPGVCVGSIPAWAGEPGPRRKGPRRKGVYPRVGGGTRSGSWLQPRMSGLSPRGRGNPRMRGRAELSLRSIPAWAGEPTEAAVRSGSTRVYPRVGGGTRISGAASIPCSGLSPRGRGNPLQRYALSERFGSIPAWAGEPIGRGATSGWPWVYPRVGGGTVADALVSAADRGLSPRGRGNRDRPHHRSPRSGSIPAWAGEPRSSF